MSQLSPVALPSHVARPREVFLRVSAGVWGVPGHGSVTEGGEGGPALSRGPGGHSRRGRTHAQCAGETGPLSLWPEPGRLDFALIEGQVEGFLSTGRSSGLFSALAGPGQALERRW